jgi:hypothetical protein
MGAQAEQAAVAQYPAGASAQLPSCAHTFFKPTPDAAQTLITTCGTHPCMGAQAAPAAASQCPAGASAQVILDTSANRNRHQLGTACAAEPCMHDRAGEPQPRCCFMPADATAITPDVCQPNRNGCMSAAHIIRALPSTTQDPGTAKYNTTTHDTTGRTKPLPPLTLVRVPRQGQPQAYCVQWVRQRSRCHARTRS